MAARLSQGSRLEKRGLDVLIVENDVFCVDIDRDLWPAALDTSLGYEVLVDLAFWFTEVLLFLPVFAFSVSYPGSLCLSFSDFGTRFPFPLHPFC